RMHPAADPASAAGDKNRVARIAAKHDHFVTTEKRGHGVRSQNPSLFEIGDGMKCERTGYARHRIKIDVPDVTIFCEQSFDLPVTERFWTDRPWLAAQIERSSIDAQRHFARFIKFDWQVLETHSRLLSQNFRGVAETRVHRPQFAT